ncbi:MAG: FlgD immunoglobulin-like domain containing protein [bacterium]
MRLTIYNTLGRKIRTLVKRKHRSGDYFVTWNGIDERGNMVASGLYFYRLQAGQFVQTRKMLLLR